MRAVFLKELDPTKVNVGDILDLRDHQFHHLKNVVRIEKNETILGLNGNGLELFLEYESDDKKSLRLIVKKCSIHQRIVGPKAAIGVLKKDGMEETLKLAVEMGLEKIIFLNTKYSQRGLSLSAFSDRFFRIMETALMQSNNIFFPTIEGPLNFADFLQQLPPESSVFYYGLGESCNPLNTKIDLPDPGKNFCNLVTLIGPEGGLSPEEEEMALARPHSLCFRLPMPILRTPHAMSVARGHVIGLYSALKSHN